MTIYPQLIIDALKTVRYPGTGKDIVEMGMVEDNIRIDGMNVTFSLLFERSFYPVGCKSCRNSHPDLYQSGSKHQKQHYRQGKTVGSSRTGQTVAAGKEYHCCLLRQRRSGKKHGGSQFGCGFGSAGLQSRLVRCRYLRPFPT